VLDTPDPADARATFAERLSNIAVELRFFLCSYALLFVILAIRFTRPALSYTCLALALIGALAGFGTIRSHRRVEPEPLQIRKVQDGGGEVAGYLAAYLLPFVTVAQPGWRDLLAYGLFMFVNGIVYVRSSLVQLNPTLYLAGWRVYALELGESASSGYIISRHAIRGDETVNAVRLTDRLSVDYRRRP
jgi:hypothetical protein